MRLNGKQHDANQLLAGNKEYSSVLRAPTTYLQVDSSICLLRGHFVHDRQFQWKQLLCAFSPYFALLFKGVLVSRDKKLLLLVGHYAALTVVMYTASVGSGPELISLHRGPDTPPKAYNT